VLTAIISPQLIHGTSKFMSSILSGRAGKSDSISPKKGYMLTISFSVEKIINKFMDRGSVNTDDQSYFMHEEKDNEDHGGHGPTSKDSSILGGALNTANTILGAGVIALPFIMKVFGIFLGMILVVGSAALALLTVYFLLLAKDLTG
jgi:hypothetical protein